MCEQVRWWTCVVCGILGGGHPPWALSLLASRGVVRMPISRSIRVTSVGEINNTICEGEQ